MTWYCENRSRRETPWNEGDLVRYDYGPAALMRVVTSVRPMGADPRGISCSVRYYGRAFHSSGVCTGRYHGQCLEPTTEDRAIWARCHDENDEWIRGAWGGDSDGTATAADCGDNPVPQDCQARAIGIAQAKDSNNAE